MSLTEHFASCYTVNDSFKETVLTPEAVLIAKLVYFFSFSSELSLKWGRSFSTFKLVQIFLSTIRALPSAAFNFVSASLQMIKFPEWLVCELLDVNSCSIPRNTPFPVGFYFPLRKILIYKIPCWGGANFKTLHRFLITFMFSSILAKILKIEFRLQSRKSSREGKGVPESHFSFLKYLSASWGTSDFLNSGWLPGDFWFIWNKYYFFHFCPIHPSLLHLSALFSCFPLIRASYNLLCLLAMQKPDRKVKHDRVFCSWTGNSMPCDIEGNNGFKPRWGS